jgi:hypothetical protein
MYLASTLAARLFRELRTLEFPYRATGTGSLMGAPSRGSEGG